MDFIKLNRLDNSPIWLNASYIVTIEPRKGGGSIVVPMGDGLDYDVRESPESVLAMLGCGENKPEPKPEPAAEVAEERPAAAKKATKARTPRKTKAKAKAAEENPEPAAEAPKPAEEPKSAEVIKPVEEPAAVAPEASLTADQIERLRKMAPRSVRKLLNTLSAHFKVGDADRAFAELQQLGVVTVDHEHLAWNA